MRSLGIDHVHPFAAGIVLGKSKKKVCFGNVEMLEIESCNAGVIPDTSHDKSYSHGFEYSHSDRRNAERIAIVKALNWHELICAEYGLPIVVVRSDSALRNGLITEPTPKSVASAIYEPGVRRWLVDTGCPFDFIAYNDLESTEANFVKKASKLVRMATPNGVVDADKIVSFSVPELGEPIDAYIMKSSPTVMSIGRRCVTMGYTFVWNPYKKPYIVTPKKRKITLEVIDHVPYLPLSRSVPCAAGPVASEEAITPEQDAAELGVQENLTYELAKVGKRDLKAEALSVERMLTHLPKNPYCSVCRRAKLENVKTKKHGGVEAHAYVAFGQHVTADTIVLCGLLDRGVGNMNNAIVFFDF